MPTSPASSSDAANGDYVDPAVNGQAGVLAPSTLGWASTAGSPSAQVARLMRFVSPTPKLITKLAFSLTTAASLDDSVDVGLYDSTGARLVSVGPTNGILNGAAGVKVLTLPTPQQVLANTPYYAAFLMGTIAGTAAQVLLAAISSSLRGQEFGSAAGTIELAAVTLGASTLPASLAIASSGGTGVVMAARTA